MSTVLLAEDDAILALDLSQEIETQDCNVLGPFETCAKALDSLRQSKPDYAIIDYFLKGDTALSLGKALEARAIPYFILTTGEDEVLKTDLSPEAILAKPIDIDQITARLKLSRLEPAS